MTTHTTSLPPAAADETPVFRIRETLAGQPERPLPPPTQDPELSEGVLEAMQRLEDLLGSTSAGGIRPCPVPAPALPEPPARNPEPSTARPAESPEPPSRWRRLTRGLSLVGVLVLGMGVAMGARPAPQQVRKARPSRWEPVAERPLPPVLEAYRQRAVAGDRSAMRLLAFCLQEGLEGARDDHEAARWQVAGVLAGDGEARPEPR